MGPGGLYECNLSSQFNKTIYLGPFVSKYINFAFKIFLLRRQEFFDFSVDFFDNFGPPESQRVIK